MCTIVIVLDVDTIVAQVLANLLMEAGYQVIVAKDGAHVAEILKIVVADFVVVDLEREVVPALYGTIPLIGLTSQPETTLPNLQAVLKKPFKPVDLLDLIRKLVTLYLGEA